MNKTKPEIITSIKEIYLDKEVRLGSNLNTSFGITLYKEDDIYYVDINLGPVIDGDHNSVFRMHYPDYTDLEKMAKLLTKTADLIKENFA